MKIKNNAKEKIDDIFDKLDQLEKSADRVTEEHKEKLNREMNDMRKSKDTLSDLYDNLLEASEDSLRYLKNAFDQMSNVMIKRIETIRKSYKGTLEV